MLDRESAKRDYYEQLLFIRMGVVGTTTSKEINLEDYEPIHKMTTLSSVRHQAEMMSRQKAREARRSEMTEAEELFSKALGLENG